MRRAFVLAVLFLGALCVSVPAFAELKFSDGVILRLRHEY
jgi:hypothetical protein